MRMSLLFLTLFVPLQIVLGDLHGLNTLQHQPAKVAAMEGLWETQRGVAASLFAIPDADAEMNHFEIAIPKLASLYLTHDLNGEVKGLKEWPRADRPPVGVVYFAFRLMVGIGLFMLAIVLCGLLLWRRRRLFDTAWYLRACQLAGASGFIAVLAGWTVTEVGRQPWVVYGLMRTSAAVTPSLTTLDVLISLTAYVLAYIVIFGGGFILMRRLIRIGPTPATEAELFTNETRPKRPISAVSDTPAGQAVQKGKHDVP